MSWFKRKPITRLEQALEDNKRMFTNDARRMLADAKRTDQAFDGDAFKLNDGEEKVETMQETPVQKVATRVDVARLPHLVAQSVGALNQAKQDLIKEQKALEESYRTAKQNIQKQLDKLNLGIKAWEAAQAVYNDAQQPQKELPGLETTKERVSLFVLSL